MPANFTFPACVEVRKLAFFMIMATLPRPHPNLIVRGSMSKDERPMTDKEKAAAERAERLSKQLRNNLRRRKAQTRARKAVNTKG